MEIVVIALAGLHAVVAIALVPFALPESASSVPVEGAIAIDCSGNQPASVSVSEPSTAVNVKCAKDTTVEPPTPAKAGENVFLGADCTQAGVLSSICPGAMVEISAPGSKGDEGPTANVFFPQLPASAQVVCLKCRSTNRTKDCKALINVAAASPQGPQACAVPGTSVTLQINEAGGSAQFACGTHLALMPREATKTYADNCAKEETLKDMTRSPGPENYVTLRVGKLKKKKMCFLCKQGAADAEKGAD